MTEGSTAYYVPVQPIRDGYERFSSTEHTVSVWAPTMQHGAPPSALLARALERCAPREGTRLAQIAVELLGPVPVSEVEVRAWIARPGRRVEMVAAELVADRPDGSTRAVATATAWRITQSDTASYARSADAPMRPGPSPGSQEWVFPPDWRNGYLDSLEFGGATRPPTEGGPGRAWARPLVPLVDHEVNSPLTQLMSVADIANGVGARLDPAEFTFLNTELTVHVAREPRGEWIGIESEASIGPDGIGMCAGVLHDADGAIGRIAQILEIQAR